MSDTYQGRKILRRGATVVRGGSLYHYATFRYDHVNDTYEILIPGPNPEADKGENR